MRQHPCKYGVCYFYVQSYQYYKVFPGCNLDNVFFIQYYSNFSAFIRTSNKEIHSFPFVISPSFSVVREEKVVTLVSA